jgi:hypothetical protein
VRAVPRLVALLAVVSGVAVAACGNSRTPVPDVVTPGPPLGHSTASYPKLGIEFATPQGWSTRSGSGTLVATVQTGDATVAIWRYPRAEPLPKTRAALVRARRQLIRAAKRRDKTFKVGTSRILRLRGAPAIQLVGRENIGGMRRRVRSTHVFAHAAEVVVDSYAPPRFFPKVDREVFKPLLKSLRVKAPEVAKKKKAKKK